MGSTPSVAVPRAGNSCEPSAAHIPQQLGEGVAPSRTWCLGGTAQRPPQCFNLALSISTPQPDSATPYLSSAAILDPAQQAVRNVGRDGQGGNWSQSRHPVPIHLEGNQDPQCRLVVQWLPATQRTSVTQVTSQEREQVPVPRGSRE